MHIIHAFLSGRNAYYHGANSPANVFHWVKHLDNVVVCLYCGLVLTVPLNTSNGLSSMKYKGEDRQAVVWNNSSSAASESQGWFEVWLTTSLISVKWVYPLSLEPLKVKTLRASLLRVTENLLKLYCGNEEEQCMRKFQPAPHENNSGDYRTDFIQNQLSLPGTLKRGPLLAVRRCLNTPKLGALKLILRVRNVSPLNAYAMAYTTVQRRIT